MFRHGMTWISKAMVWRIAAAENVSSLSYIQLMFTSSLSSSIAFSLYCNIYGHAL